MPAKVYVEFLYFEQKGTTNKTLTEFLCVMERTGLNFEAHMAFITNLRRVSLSHLRPVLTRSLNDVRATAVRSLPVLVSHLPVYQNGRYPDFTIPSEQFKMFKEKKKLRKTFVGVSFYEWM